MIESRGLALGCLQDEDGCVCTVRALQAQVLGDSFLVPWWESPDEVMPDSYAQALAAAGLFLGWPSWWGSDLLEEQLLAWNDTGNTTAGLAAEVLRGAAAALAFRRPVGADA